MVLSPLHIPDEEAIGLAAELSPPSSPNPRVTDLSSDVTSPTYVCLKLAIACHVPCSFSSRQMNPLVFLGLLGLTCKSRSWNRKQLS